MTTKQKLSPHTEGWEMQYEDYEAFGDMLMLYRKHKKIRSSDFAKKHGISRATLWRIEHAKAKDIPISLHNELLHQTREDTKKEQYAQGRVDEYKDFLEKLQKRANGLCQSIREQEGSDAYPGDNEAQAYMTGVHDMIPDYFGDISAKPKEKKT